MVARGRGESVKDNGTALEGQAARFNRRSNTLVQLGKLLMGSSRFDMRFVGLPIAFALLAVGCGNKTEQLGGRSSGAELFELCVQCHGEDGTGNQAINTPAIAGLSQWYIETQLRKFKSGVRGSHFDDLSGMQMRPMAMSVAEADIPVIAAYVANLPPSNPVAVVEGGNAVRGKELYTPCTACHGANGAGNEQLKAPELTEASDWYLLAQLRKFKAGVRGADPNDVEGGQMRPMAQALADEQAMKDVVAHIMTLK